MRHPPARRTHPAVALLALAGLVIGMAISQTARAAPTMDAFVIDSTDHLVISEVMSGGASASDEFVELYNPVAAPLALDGLELVYVTASGATITRKAIWGPGAEVPGHGHVLVANEAGIFAGIADATYANGLAATGGSMALRVAGAAMAIDAVGWGTAASSWLEGQPAPAPSAGSSLERLPGGELGSGQDSDDNLVDFVVRGTPDPQNSASPPVPDAGPSAAPSTAQSLAASPSPTPEATATPTPGPTSSVTAGPSPTQTPAASPPEPTPEPTSAPPSPGPAPMTIAEARGAPDGSLVVVAGVTLTDSAFTEGGGYLADATGGIALLLADGTVPRGVELVVRGVVDDRFSQRTIRAEVTDVAVIGPGSDPVPMSATTGAVGESHEGQLVSLEGAIDGPPTSLTSGVAYDLDDGSGPIRLLVGPGTGIDTTPWAPGAVLSLVGVVGQRDSSGTGVNGYRVQPRDQADLASVLPPVTPQPTPSPPAPTPSASPSPTPPATPVMSIADARVASVGATVRIRGVITVPTGLVEAGSAVVEDESGAILVRSSANERLRRGQLVELAGTRSTKSGMASIRLGEPALVLGSQPDPAPPHRRTGQIREADEARLVIVRGLVGDGPRRTTGGGLTLTLDDGSGELRVFVASGTGISVALLPSGSWVEVRGVVGQQTTGNAPTSGYRLWPRDGADVRVIAPASGAGPQRTTTVATGSRAPGAHEGPTTAPRAIAPRLDGAAAFAPGSTPGATGRTATKPPAELPAPLALGLGGLAGLATLAWRHGTWSRLQRDVLPRVGRRLAAPRTSTHDGEDDESYTLAP